MLAARQRPFCHAMSDQNLPPLKTKDHLYGAMLRFFSLLPLRWLQGIGGFLGLLVARARNSSPAFVIKRNLDLCFPEESEQWRTDTTLKCMRSTGTGMLECAKTWGEPPSYSVGMIRKVHNEAVIDEAIAAGKGTIAIVPHFGNWEFMNAWLNTKTPTTIMYKPGKNPGVDRFVLDARSRLDATLVPTDERGVKALFKSLRQNGFTAILPDHTPLEAGGIYAPFFGISTLTGVLTSKLVQKTKCSVIVMYCLRRPDGDGFEVHLTKPDENIYSDDLLTSVTALNKTVENVIRVAPEQYQWSYKRFKRCENLKHAYDRKKQPVFTSPHPASKLFETRPGQ